MAYTYDELRSMLFDVVTVLDLSDEVYEKHGPLGTAPSVLVQLVLDQKDREIAALKAGLVEIKGQQSIDALLKK